jgi:hypothetical protein
LLGSAGKDASEPFTTGDVFKDGSKKDLDDLPATQRDGVKRYMPNMIYKQIGVVCCEFYDADGKTTEKLTNTKQRIASHVALKEGEKKNKEL